MNDLENRVAQAIEDTEMAMNTARYALPEQKREPYFDKVRAGKPIVGYRAKLREAQAKAAIAVVQGAKP